MASAECCPKVLTAESPGIKGRKGACPASGEGWRKKLRHAGFAVDGWSGKGWDVVAESPLQGSNRLLDILHKFINRIVPDACPLGKMHENIVHPVRDVGEKLLEINHPVSGQQG